MSSLLPIYIDLHLNQKRNVLNDIRAMYKVTRVLARLTGVRDDHAHFSINYLPDFSAINILYTLLRGASARLLENRSCPNQSAILLEGRGSEIFE